jgi:hypothetical protein
MDVVQLGLIQADGLALALLDAAGFAFEAGLAEGECFCPCFGMDAMNFYSDLYGII